jgi:hypothetical protein
MEKIVAMCPAVEMARLACSGTEATMHALRVARAFTGREVVIKFEGMYHGFHDYMLFSTYAPVEAYGSYRSPIPIPSSSGIPKALNDLVVTLPFNDFEVLEKTLRRVGYETAAIIAEPCMGNCGAILPAPGFLEFIRQKCTEYGIVFILDEVKTAFASPMAVRKSFTASIRIWPPTPKPSATATQWQPLAARKKSCKSSGTASRRAAPITTISPAWRPLTPRSACWRASQFWKPLPGAGSA